MGIAELATDRINDRDASAFFGDEEDADLLEQLTYDELVLLARERAKREVDAAIDSGDLINRIVDLVMSYEILADAAESRASAFIRECQERTE